ncbi:type II secretion system F family protein [Anaerococcus hydrogenalis]|uniref:Type II secretion system F family protein n=1 Tax=Anaerococcus hydrogenalis TaxID=33029 RepID=A0A2N6UKP8_9FIRM|nr:type II secretion system F family protein [Anaerococcus hydrogenalis]MBS5989483.1 type II secretion system F family protein [Anaerococcus hydrogenalis]MDK7694304.1 type II secretion system F family protein [Anaerococcus hydrogenalis]MDK7696082.1 type II secretion system F family protein [Anaerococcus hydrogenalis]MDK7707331.1 type II secretion system F family protein [Anaerococcus hydrogenalis]PMC82354.1 type II secretion system F family protein [Anaerococcus hydrogenalis]
MNKFDKLRAFLNKDIGIRKINSNILSLFLKQLSLLIDSSVSIYDSLMIIIDQSLDKKLNKALVKVSLALKDGHGAYEAFLKEEKSFGPIITAFIKSGDASGKMPEILDELSGYLTEESKYKNKIIEALIYPIILLVVTIVVVIIILIKVLPTFIEVFEDNGTKLPKSTKILLESSSFISENGLYILLFVLIFVFLIFLLRQREDYRFKIDKFLFNSIFFNKFRMINIEYKITSLLFILKKGDIDIIESINIIKKSFKNLYLRYILDNVQYSLELGNSLSDSLENENVFTKLFIAMIKVGEDSGDMVGSLKKAADYYANEYIYRLKRLSSMAEPFLILFMALLVGFVVFSVAIPMFDSVNNVNF